MAREHDSDDRALADRLVNYADALVALSVVGVSGVGIALADPDTRESFIRGADWVIASNCGLGVLFTGFVMLLRSWETDLRSGAPPSQKTARYSRYLHAARLIVIWVSVAQAAGLMLVLR